MHPRRQFLLMSFAGALLARLRRVAAAPLAAGTPWPANLSALPVYLDVLLPHDETPSATALGIDRTLIEAARGKQGLRVLREGCRWLDTQARAAGADDFAALDEAARERIVAQAARSNRGSGAREFFEQTRDAAFTLYYARPESWPALGFAGPPQPRGYPDFERPPGGTGS